MLFFTIFTCRLLLKLNTFPFKFTSEKSTFNINTHMINNTHRWVKKVARSGDLQFSPPNTCFSSLFHLNFFSYTSWLASVEKKTSITRVTLTCSGRVFSAMFTDCVDQKSCRFQFNVSRFTKVVWGFFLFLKYCGLKLINSQNLKMLKYWLTQLLITGCSYRELEEPPMGFLLQQYCTYYMNKLHCCIMQLLHHQFRE